MSKDVTTRKNVASENTNVKCYPIYIYINVWDISQTRYVPCVIDHLYRDVKMCVFFVVGAYAAKQESHLGAIEMGKLADFVVLKYNVAEEQHVSKLVAPDLIVSVWVHGQMRFHAAANKANEDEDVDNATRGKMQETGIGGPGLPGKNGKIRICRCCRP
jgi:hypothetical protein